MALPSQLQNPIDPAVLRRSIMKQLGTVSSRLSGFGGDSAFDNMMRALYRQATSDYSAQDQAEQRYLGDYEKTIANRALKEGQIRESLRNSFANRGILSSGIFTNEGANLERDFSDSRDQLASEKTRNIEDINNRRTNILNDLMTKRGLSEANYSTDIASFLNQQALTEAQQASQQALARQQTRFADTRTATTAPRRVIAPRSVRPVVPRAVAPIQPTVPRVPVPTPRPVVPVIRPPRRMITIQTRYGPARKAINESRYAV